MRILYFFQEIDTPMFQWQRLHFINELNHHGIEFITFNPLVYSSPDEANEKIVEVASNGRFDLFMSSVGYYKMLYVDTLEKIKSLGIPTFTISWDNLMAPYLDEVLAPHFDLIMLTANETERLYKKWNANCFFAPYAANPYIYTYDKTNKIIRSACFIGTPHGSRAVMINQLTNNGIPVNLYHGRGSNTEDTGNKIEVKYRIIYPSELEIVFDRFRFKEGRRLLKGSIINRIKGQTTVCENENFHRYPGLSFTDMVNMYSKSALALAFSSAGHTDTLNNPLKLLNLRNFEIPMCGGIQLCKYSDELASYFDDGKEIVLYKDNEELLDKARYYIEKASDSELLKIKAAARKRSENEHTWWCRFTKAFDALGLKY